MRAVKGEKPAVISWAIVSGSSRRGLSLVTMMWTRKRNGFESGAEQLS